MKEKNACTRQMDRPTLIIVDVLVRFDLIWVWVVEGKKSLDLVDIFLRFDLNELMHEVVLGKCRFDWVNARVK